MKQLNLTRKSNLFFCMVVFFSLLSFFSSASSGEELLMSKYFFTGDSFSINNNDYSITISSSHDKAYIDAGESYYWLDVSDCEENDYVKICLDSIVYDESRDNYKSYLKIYSLVPIISVTQTASATSLEWGDESEIDVVLTNNGAVDATDVEYSVEIPKTLELVSYPSSATYVDSKLYFTIDVSNSETTEFDFKVKAKETGSGILKSSVEYYDGFTDQNAYSSSLTLTSSAPYSLSLSANDTSIMVGDPVLVTLSLQNTAGEKINLENFNVYVPSCFRVDSYDDEFEIINDFYSFSEEMTDNETNEFEFELTSICDAVSGILVEGNFIKDSKILSIDESLKITSEIHDMQIRPFFVTLSLASEKIYVEAENDKITMESLQNGVFEVYIDNPSPTYSIKDIVVNGVSELFNISGHIQDSLLSSASKKIAYKSMVVPEVSSTTSEDMIYYINFTTEFGYSYNQKVEQTVSILPVKDLVVKHSFSDSTPASDDEIKVTVTIKNNREIDIKDLIISEHIPSVLSVRGPTSAKLDIDQGETETVYEYYLKIPLLDEKTNYDIYSNCSYLDGSNSYTFSSEDTIKASPRKPSITFKRSVDSRTVSVGEIVDVDYNLKNNEDYTLYDMKIDFPYISRTYLVDEINYVVSELNPSQELSLDDIENRIFLENTTGTSSRSINPTEILFTDNLGTKFSKDSSKLSMKVEEANIDLPLIEINSDIINSTNEYVKYYVEVKNFGDSLSSFNIVSGSYNEKISLDSQESYKKVLDVTRNHIEDYIPRSYLYFKKGAKTYYAVSQKLDIPPLEISKEEDERDDDIIKEVSDSSNEKSNQESSKDSSEIINNNQKKPNTVKETQEDAINNKSNNEKKVPKDESAFMSFLRKLYIKFVSLFN